MSTELARWAIPRGGVAALLGASSNVRDWRAVRDDMSYSSRVQAVCDASGPSDLLRLYHDASDPSSGTRPKAISAIDALLGGPAEQNKTKAIAASPITYVPR